MVLAIGIYANQGDAFAWMMSYNLTYPVLYDENAEVTPDFVPDLFPPYGLYAVPYSCIVDDGQIMQYTHEGYHYFPGDSTIYEIIEMVESLLTPELGASIEEVDFGLVPVDSSASLEIYLDNVRTGIVDVLSASVGGPPFSVDFTPGEIYAVDDSLLVTVTFEPSESGTFEDTLIIQSDAGDLSIPLTGEGQGSSVDRNDEFSPERFELIGNYPNPFNASTSIYFTLPGTAQVTIEVFDVSGANVAEIDGGLFNPGNHSMNFDASDLTSGIYFYRLSAGDFSATHKMILLR